MPLVDLHSNRNVNPPDLWEYDTLPQKLRVQVSNLIRRALGRTSSHEARYASGHIYDLIAESISHEHGRKSLTANAQDNQADVLGCVEVGTDILIWLDCIELSFRCIERMRGNYDKHARRMADITIPAQDAVSELNERFRRAGFGYRYEQGQVIRIDSEHTHQELTRPALLILADPKFEGANEEFRAAHDHFKAGEYKDCAVDALNAVESTMKVICDQKKWQYPKGARASDLIKILRREGLFPEFADQSFDQLVSTLKSGLPAVRNESGGHGQGAAPIQVPLTWLRTL
jgi:HEPN domain-containing protein